MSSNYALGKILSCSLKRVIKTVFGKAHRERTPGLVINLVFIVEIVLIMKVVLALVASKVGVPRVSIDISCSARIDRIRAIGVNIGVTIEFIAVANEDFGPLTQTTSGQDF
jgi:carbon starvation protein CstA